MSITWSTGRFFLFLGMAITACILFAGCVHRGSERSLNDWVAPSADRVWVPPHGTVSENPPETRTPDIPQDLLNPEKKWQLTDIIDIALRNNTKTRSAWYAARSAAADWLGKKGDYYPQISATGELSHTEQTTSETVPDRSVDSFEPALEVSWLLFDFGGRSASIEEKRQALLAANFTHNAAVQDAVLMVLQTYFQYANAKAMGKAFEISLNEAAANLESARQRHENGLATIADVLQAQTAFSQAKLNMDSIHGQVQTIRGALATAMGIPANTPYDIEGLPSDPPVNQVTEAVEAYIRKAEVLRPDLAAQKSRVEESMAGIRSARSSFYPNLVLGNRLSGVNDSSTSEWENRNITSLTVNIPIFSGYATRYDVHKARQDAEAQKARLEGLEQTVILQVWSSYFNLKTSEQRLKTSSDLLQSAQQSHDVAIGRYREGVGGFLDLMAAQSMLESARAQRVSALADWYISFAQLARDTGMLWGEEADMRNVVLDSFSTSTIKEPQP